MYTRVLYPVLGQSILLGLMAVGSVHGQLVISGNENKIDLTSGVPELVEDAADDSLSFIDFSSFPPNVRHVKGITNTVIGPPSNIAITPDGDVALLANSLKINRQATPDPWEPARDVHLLDIKAVPPAIIATVKVGRQPSGISISPDGRLALVANRADGTITSLGLSGRELRRLDTIKVCEADESVSDVAIHPNGRMALASVQKGGYLAVLTIDDLKVSVSEHRLSVYGEPYRVVITPDGQLGLTAGQGKAANGVDSDALSVIDLTVEPIRTVDYVALGAVPESIEVSPDGKWVAAVLMAGSNFAATDLRHSDHGQLVLLRRDGKTYRVAQRREVGRIPEGVAFTSDGKYLLVQCHADRQIWVFRMGVGGTEDKDYRIDVPGMPSSLRAAP